MARHSGGGQAPRILAGTWRGRRLEVPRGRSTRPLRALARKSLFDVLGERIVDAHVLDLYAGSGAVAFEALSRGAARATLVECGRAALSAIWRNAERLGAGGRVVVVRDRAERYVRAVGESFGFVFVGAPYPMWTGRGSEPLFSVLAALPHLLVPGGLAVVESRGARPISVPLLRECARRRFGDTVLHYLEDDRPPGAGSRPPSERPI